MSRPLGPGQAPRRPVRDDAPVARVSVPVAGAVPALVTANGAGVDLAAWVAHERAGVCGLLDRHAAVLLRGFVADAADLPRILRPLAGEALPYEERSSPRTALGDGVYTSTDHPAHQTITLHNENSYQAQYPALLAFHCTVPATAGGGTTLADCRGVLARLDPALVERFASVGVRYVRNHHAGIGVSWQETFGTCDRDEVESYCLSRRIGVRWRADGGLRTSQVRPALTRHSRTGELVWFNHAAFFHPHGLPPDVRAALDALIPREEDLPHYVTFGDGSPIAQIDMDAIRAAYDAETVVDPWQTRDVLLVDNVLAAHGRQPYQGRRRVAVAMAGAVDRSTQDPGDSAAVAQ